MNVYAQSSDDIIITSVCLQDRSLLWKPWFFSDADNNQSLGETNEDPQSPSEEVKVELNDCPRDSGCYIGSDCSDNSKEDTETQLAPLSPTATEA